MLIYGQEILDLGDAGLLLLASDATANIYGPLPAHASGFARWVDPAGQEHDRLAACTLALDPAALARGLDGKRKEFGRAVASVRGRVDHLRSLVAEGYRAAPYAAAAFHGGLVLLAFETLGAPRLWRLLDVPASRVIGEWGAADIDRLLGARGPDPMPPGLSVTLFRAVAGDQAAVSVGIHGRVLQVSPQGLAPAPAHPHDEVLQCLLTPQRMLLPSYEAPEARILRFGDPSVVRYRSTAPKRQAQHFATARAAEVLALGHAGGLVEVVDLETLAPRFMRPVARPSSKDAQVVRLSPSARFVLVADPAQDPAAVLVDLQEGRSAPVRLAAGGIDIDRHGFSPQVVYRTVDAMTDRGGYVLEDGRLEFTPFDALAWTPIDITGDAARPQPRPAVAGQVPALVEQLRWPAMALRPSRKAAQGGSQKYGTPTVQVADWPRHDGRPMLLLCQLDLAQATACRAARGWGGPESGWLLVFTAYDDDEGPVLDDSFHPAAIAVRWLPADAPAAGAVPAGVPRLAAVPLQLRPDPSELPQTDSAVVTALNLDGGLLDAYGEHVERQLPEGAVAGDRLGGYPHLIQNNDLEATAAERFESDPARWRLLLQLDSDDEIMWGTDSGMLYLLVHLDDLASGDFSRVVALAEGC